MQMSEEANAAKYERKAGKSGRKAAYYIAKANKWRRKFAKYERKAGHSGRKAAYYIAKAG